jgi:signal transduction histidine kinase
MGNKGLDKEAELKNTFMSVVSHETQTPLAIIQESLSLLMDEIPGPLTESQSRLMKIAQENVARVSRLIADMSDWVNLQSGNVSLECANFNLVFLMKQEIERAKELATKKDITVSFASELPQNAVVVGDEIKIDQVFDRILNNALNYTDANGCVTVDIQEHDCYFRVLIKDSGPGISAEDLAKIFTPMQQFHRTYAPGSQGVGLSLALCKKWMELHGGGLDICSQVGKGTELVVTLPKSIMYRKA